MSGATTEDEPGQITAAVGRACLRFKNVSELEGQKLFVKCSFPGRGTSIFVPSIDDPGEPAAASTAAVVPPDNTFVPLRSVQSAPVDIVVVSSQPEKESGVPDIGIENAGPGTPRNDADTKEIDWEKSLTSIDLGFTLDSTKFGLTEANLSSLENTEMQIELCLHGVDGTETVVGAATARVANVLRGKNKWCDNLPLGTYSHLVQAAFDTKNSEGETDAVNNSKEGADAEGHGEVVITDKQAALVDASLGPLEFGGSTSTVCVTLLTDDGTSDYTVGGGSLWTDGAEVAGVPEGWKIQPPPETEHSGWNDAIAQILAEQPKHEYSIWWGGDQHCLDDTTGRRVETPFPSMRLDGGVLSYKPDPESTDPPSIHGDCSRDGDPGDAAVASVSSNGENGGVNDSAKEEPRIEPPTGTWSVRFPASQARSVFLHRTSIRMLRRALMANPPIGGGGDGIADESPSRERQGAPSVTAAAMLPVFVERRPLKPAIPTEAEQPKGGKKGAAKKGAGKAGKAGGVAPEAPPETPETPWRCKAILDLSDLVEPVSGNGGDGTRRNRGSALGRQSIVENGCGVNGGDSPLSAELMAALAHEPGEESVVAGVHVEGADASTVAANEGDAAVRQPAGGDGESLEKPAINEVETRTEQMAASNMRLSVIFALTRPLAKAPTRQATGASVSDVFAPKDVGPWKPPRDVDEELKEELDAFVLAVLAEYAKLFLQPGADRSVDELSPEDREKHLFYALNSGGLYHSFLEKLKPRVQRIVRKRFGAVPTDTAQADAFMAGLYAHLVEQAAVVLNQRIKNVEAKEIPSYVITDSEKSLDDRVGHLGILADDAEARGDRQEAAARHEDCIEAATAAAAARAEWRILLARAWEAYARFSLRGSRQRRYRAENTEPGNSNNKHDEDDDDSNENNNLDHATRCLEESLRVYPPGSEMSLAATTVLAAVAMEQDQLDRASALLEAARGKRLPEVEEGADGYETDQLSGLIPRRDHALACLLRDLMGDAPGARRCLFLAVLSSRSKEAADVDVDKGSIVVDDEPGAPRRTAVRIMHDMCAWLLELGLSAMAGRAFAVAEESERLAVKKAKGRGLPTRTPTVLRESSRRLQCSLILAEGMSTSSTPTPSVETMSNRIGTDVAGRDYSSGSRGERAEMLAQEAVELVPGDPRPWQALAEACDAQGGVKASEAADAWAAVLDRMEEAWGAGKRSVPPLRVYMRLGSLYNSLGRTNEAKACFLRACRAWRAPGPWLGCGAACLRLEQWEEAEDALQHASRLDCNSSLVWGNLALLLLSLGEDRLEEANRALSQARRLGLADAPLLREIGTCYVAIGRLEAAEEVLRLSLAVEVNGGGGGGGGRAGGSGNPHTRRRLADVLSARNATSQAVEEYRRVLESPSADESERQEVLTRCGNLLRKMGRNSELDQLREACSSRGKMGGEGAIRAC